MDMKELQEIEKYLYGRFVKIGDCEKYRFETSNRLENGTKSFVKVRAEIDNSQRDIDEMKIQIEKMTSLLSKVYLSITIGTIGLAIDIILRLTEAG